MRFERLPIDGAHTVALDPATDERGSFERTFDAESFAAAGLVTVVAQAAISRNPRAATLRGMHLQGPPNAEAKLIRCHRGAIYDVLIDLRPSSPTFRQWSATELTAVDPIAVYAPAGVAHGFLTLVDDTEVGYHLSEPYRPDSGTGVRWDDPAFGVSWPMPPVVLSPRDASWPDFSG